MPLRLLVLLVSVSLLGGVTLSSCGSDEDSGGPDTAQALAATGEKGTARASMRMRMEGAGLPAPIRMTAEGVTALREPRGRLRMDLGPLLALAGQSGAGEKTLELLLDGSHIYVRPPRLEDLEIPEGKSWIELDLRAVARAAGLPTKGFGALMTLDPSSQLRAMKSAKGLEEVGKEKVDGAETTHYKGTLRLSDLIEELPARERADAREALEAMKRFGGEQNDFDRPTPTEMWIDESGLLRRSRTTSKLPSQAGVPPGSFSFDYRLRDFGAELDTTPPPASERYDATDVVSEVLDGISGVTR